MRKSLILMAVATVIASCTENAAPDKGYGTMQLNVQQDLSVAMETKSDISEFVKLPSSGDFDITVQNYAGATYWQGKLKDWSNEFKMMEGEYTVIANYGNSEIEGEGKVFFNGSATCTVTAFQQSLVTVTVKTGNAIVRLATSKMFKTYFSSYNFSISTGAGNSFQIAEGQNIFVDAFKFTLNGSCTTADGKTATFSKEYTNLAPATCYSVTIDVTNVGSNSITIHLNNDVETISIQEELN